MALADNELAPTDAAAARDAIAADPELARRFAMFAETRGLLGRAHAGALSEPVPARLLAAIAAADAPGEHDGARVVPLASRGRPAWQPLALAASLALMLGGVVGFTTARLAGPIPGTGIDMLGAAAASLAAALEQDVSGGERRFDGGRVVVLHTHPVSGGGICRDFVVTTSTEIVGLACRSEGAWRSRALFARGPAAADNFRPAGTDDVLREVLDRLGAGAPLDTAGEAALITRGWR